MSVRLQLAAVSGVWLKESIIESTVAADVSQRRTSSSCYLWSAVSWQEPGIKTYPQALLLVDLKHSHKWRSEHHERYDVAEGGTYMLQQNFLGAQSHGGGAARNQLPLQSVKSWRLFKRLSTGSEQVFEMQHKHERTSDQGVPA